MLHSKFGPTPTPDVSEAVFPHPPVRMTRSKDDLAFFGFLGIAIQSDISSGDRLHTDELINTTEAEEILEPLRSHVVCPTIQWIAKHEDPAERHVAPYAWYQYDKAASFESFDASDVHWLVRTLQTSEMSTFLLNAEVYQIICILPWASIPYGR
jgi:hypothetical protein